MTKWAKTARKSTGGKAPRMTLPPPLDSDDELPPAHTPPGGPAKDHASPGSILEQPGSGATQGILYLLEHVDNVADRAVEASSQAGSS
ncbi:hypothetical protein FRC10_006120 [Ceratobasidium sp. 414]|nr:hypothetical protein FRC10_006120 [Ceratobasidium sp. 414]